MKVTVIVPYRNRARHLKIFVPHILKFLRHYDTRIVVVEQGDQHPFNRGALLNIGYLCASPSDWIVFHDVDMLPLDVSCDYSGSDIACHLAGCAEQFGYKMPYINYCGGVMLFTCSAFSAINGYSNGYWGWGCEDDDLYLRLCQKNILIEHRSGRFRSLPHESSWDAHTGANHSRFGRILNQVVSSVNGDREVDPRQFRQNRFSQYQLLTAESENISRDGLSTAAYKISRNISLGNSSLLDMDISASHRLITVELNRDHG